MIYDWNEYTNIFFYLISFCVWRWKWNKLSADHIFFNYTKNGSQFYRDCQPYNQGADTESGEPSNCDNWERWDSHNFRRPQFNLSKIHSGNQCWRQWRCWETDDSGHRPVCGQQVHHYQWSGRRVSSHQSSKAFTSSPSSVWILFRYFCCCYYKTTTRWWC